MSKDYITIKVKKNDYKSFKSEVLKLSMFNIEQIETHIFDKVKERI